MRRARARAWAACLGCLAVCLAFFLTAVVPLPVPLYFPLSRRFGLGPSYELSMDYYGRSLLALAAGLIAAGAGYLAARRMPTRRGEGQGPVKATSIDRDHPTLLLLGAYVATALLLCVGLYAYKLSNRPARPEPLPAWYQPK
jgi:hypothetical protein